MNSLKRLRPINLDWRSVLLIGLTILVALIVGISFLIIPTYFAPILILGAVLVVSSIFILLKKPIWALYYAIFVVMLPTSLIPAQINSYLNRSAIVIALIVWMVDVINRRSRITITGSTVFLFLFIFWAAVSLLWAEDISEGINIIQRYVLRLILFLILVVNEIKTKKAFNGLMNTLAISGGILIIVSLFTVYQQGYSVGHRLQVLDVNQNELGISLLLTMPAVFWWSRSSSSKPYGFIKKILAAIFLIASIGLIGLSGSRGSAISIGLMLIVFLFWKYTRLWGILGLVFIGLAVIVFPIMFETTIDRFLGAPGETVLGGREYIWPVAWLLIKDHLLFGIGIGNSPYQVIPYLVNAGIMRLSLLSISEISIHNPLLVIWAETGLPGLIIYLGLLISAVIAYIRQYFVSRKMRDDFLMPYFALVSSMFIGYMASWIKGGGMETGTSYFLIIALLLVPSQVILEKNNIADGHSV